MSIRFQVVLVFLFVIVKHFGASIVSNICRKSALCAELCSELLQALQTI